LTIEDLPDGFAVPTRGEIRDRFQKDYLLRQPGSPTGEGSQAFIDGSVIADALSPLYANAISIARGANLADMSRAQLQDECTALGIPIELPESAGTGFVIIAASTGGVFIDTGREIKDESRNLRFHCAVAGTYYNGLAVPIIGTDKGPTTNVPAGTKMKWSNPPAGLASIATVQEDADGNGFTGGRAVESDDDIRSRITTARADPPAGGNVAQIRALVKEAGASLGIAIQEVFVYPAITGSGHYAYIFTLRPGSPGSSRCPDAIQIAAVRAFIHKALPEDDGIFSAEIIEEEVTAKLGIVWAKTASGWVDAQPWPVYADLFAVTAVTSALVFEVESGLGASLEQAPQVGQTFAFYDRANGKFARKRILTVTDNTGGNYSLTIDSTNNASDPNYLPTVTEEFCPWSTSLDLLVEPMLIEIDTLGPGEQADGFFDEGYRQKRIPENPLEWPSELRHNSLDAVDDLPQIHDIEWLEPTIPYVPAVGVAGVSSNLIAIDVLLAFPS
jgi:uncharacterized phage protein gp47/JayE